MSQQKFHFDGEDAQTPAAVVRLTGQLERIWNLMQDRKWRTVQQIADRLKISHCSASAQLRNLRKPQFGEHTVERNAPKKQPSQYRLIPSSVEMVVDHKRDQTKMF